MGYTDKTLIHWIRYGRNSANHYYVVRGINTVDIEHVERGTTHSDNFTCEDAWDE